MAHEAPAPGTPFQLWSSVHEESYLWLLLLWLQQLYPCVLLHLSRALPGACSMATEVRYCKE